VTFVKFSDLVLEEGKYGGSRVAGLQLGGKRVCEKVGLGLLLIGLQGSPEYGLEV
jgi:hypothetical protein